MLINNLSPEYFYIYIKTLKELKLPNIKRIEIKKITN